ncbi:MurR/RpiR family transcriptional regulator [Metabacillus fastidiosus]|uniref:MurR/RpiR family transcriptional regulator n=1 Tax=Metabacillus fastidiosus TaxID=1458 RepID=UPI003D28BC90
MEKKIANRASVSGGLVMLEREVGNLPPSERKIASYILDDPQTAITLSAQKLGENSDTSSGAVMRLCKSLGLKGFQDLKLRIAGDLQKTDENIQFRDINPDENVESIASKMTNNSLLALNETLEMINYEEIEKAVQVLKKADHIHFFGLGASAIIALDAQQKFVRIKKKSYAFSDPHMIAMNIANINEDMEVIFAISFSGETHEVKKILELAKSKNITTISLTRFGNNSISKIADINLKVSASKEALFRSSATSSRMAQLLIIDILFMSLISKDYDNKVGMIDEARLALEFLRE